MTTQEAVALYRAEKRAAIEQGWRPNTPSRSAAEWDGYMNLRIPIGFSVIDGALTATSFRVRKG